MLQCNQISIYCVSLYFTLSQFSDIQLSLVSFIYRHFKLWVLQGGCHPFLDKLIHLLWCAPDERARIQHSVKLILDRIKICILSYAFNQVVLFSELFHLVRGFVRQHLSSSRACETNRKGKKKKSSAP